jgi:hypothetical protein
MTPEKATALRKPFPAESVGKLPKGGVMLDYVGHAAVTDRLLTVDPEWSWEPLALGPDGLPASTAAATCGSSSPSAASPASGSATARTPRSHRRRDPQRRDALRRGPRPVGQGEPRRVRAGRQRAIGGAGAYGRAPSIVATSGRQLFSRRIDCARGAEVGTGVSGVYDALQGVKTERGADAPRPAFRRGTFDDVAVRVIDARQAARS